MLLKRSQTIILAVVALVSTIPFLTHHVTTLLRPFSFISLLITILLYLVAFIGMFFSGLFWIFRRNTETAEHYRTWFVTFLMMILISSGFSIANLAYSRGLPIGSFVMPFNKSLWTSPSSYQYVRGDITTRQKMLGSVVQILLRDGNRQSIIANLGHPENNGFFASSGCDFIYRTGPQRDSIFPIDDEWLLIWFDSNGNTLRYEISSD